MSAVLARAYFVFLEGDMDDALMALVRSRALGPTWHEALRLGSAMRTFSAW
ncbi:hypothetical protein [Streptomyces sp. NPDC057696]|uniref:hypothetical protein n=1 Tax=Streptomyces sp. NPDC057696 TaxID=3346218 RepID=UPI0036BDE089